jgi:GPH family glycoside/pentoside/hexuronide:cation symporter
MAGVSLTAPISRKLGKKETYIFTMAALAVLSILFFYLPNSQVGFWLMLLMQIIISICTGIVSPLVWSMYADVSDYAELRDGTAATGLIFSSSSMAQKFGAAFGGAAVLWILAAFGYNTASGAVQTPEALNGLNMLMSWAPAIVAVLAIVIAWVYPLTKKRVDEIGEKLSVIRKEQQ